MDLFNKKKVAELSAEISALNITLSEKNHDIEDYLNTISHLQKLSNPNDELTGKLKVLTTWTEELEETFIKRDWKLQDKPVIPEVKKVPKKKELVKRTAKSSKAGIKALETMLASIPAGTKGRGGIDIIKNGKPKELSFSSKVELEKILKDAKAGKFEIAKQAGL